MYLNISGIVFRRSIAAQCLVKKYIFLLNQKIFNIIVDENWVTVCITLQYWLAPILSSIIKSDWISVQDILTFLHNSRSIFQITCPSKRSKSEIFSRLKEVSAVTNIFEVAWYHGIPLKFHGIYSRSASFSILSGIFWHSFSRVWLHDRFIICR